MLKIKLVRIGKVKQPFFRIVVAPARSKMNGRQLDLLGTFDPLAKTNQIKIDKDKYRSWLAKGAQPTLKLGKMIRKLL